MNGKGSQNRESTGLVAGRYRIEEPLAEGGMGTVYRALDRSRQRPVALKRIRRRFRSRPAITALFQREYHTLARLRHPRIIEVFDYGVDAEGPYYTMELLDGNDLHDISPLPYKRACLYLRDVASSLALLHTRRLLHRDLSPRNIRLTADGHCKLIDFGSMAAFGACGEIAGTPPLVPPEALRGASLDHLSDLYALGSLAFWILTRRYAYRAKRLDDLPGLWRTAPTRVSKLAEGIPAELDELVMSLINLDPGRRPSSAAEVIERLSRIAGLEPEPQIEAAYSYLLVSPLIGRESEIENVTAKLAGVMEGRGSSVLIEGEAAVGRSRLLSEFSLQAQLQGARVISVAARSHREPYGAARAMLMALLQAAPSEAGDSVKPYLPLLGHILPELEVKNLARLPQDAGEGRAAMQGALHSVFLQLARQRPLVVLVDDFHRADENSAAFIAGLAREVGDCGLMLITAVQSGAERGSRTPLRSLRSVSTRIRLRSLTLEQTEELIRSLFGSVVRTERLASRIFQITSGNPGLCLELARYLVDRNVVRYVDGIWVLPTEIREDELPRSMVEAVTARASELSAGARSFAEAMCVHRGSFAVETCLALVGQADRQQVFVALDELAGAGVLVTSGTGYAFGQESFREGLLRLMPEAQRAEAHLRLGRALMQTVAGRPEQELEAGWHLIHGGDETKGADLLARSAPRLALNGIALAAAVPALEAALEVYEKQKRPLADRLRLRSALVHTSYFHDYRLADKYGDAVVEPLYRFSGLALADRLNRVFGRRVSLYLGVMAAAIGHFFTPRSRRGPGAIRSLVYLLRSLPNLLGVRALSLDVNSVVRLFRYTEPLLGFGARHTARVIRLFCEAITLQLLGREAEQRQACLRAIEVLRDPNACREATDHERKGLLGGVLLSLGINESYRDDSRALEVAGELESVGSSLGQVYSHQVRMMYHLMRGEQDLAEEQRRKVERHAVQGGTTWQVEFWSTPVEGLISILTFDVVYQKRILEVLGRLSKRVPSLRPYLELTRAGHFFYRGMYPEAIGLASRLTETIKPRGFIGWGTPYFTLALALNRSGEHRSAEQVCSQALASISTENSAYVSMYLPLETELAYAEAGLGKREKAFQRIEELLERHRRHGHPLAMCVITYTAAHMALLVMDQEAFALYVQETRLWGARTRNPAVLAEIERLAEQGDRAGLSQPPGEAVEDEEIRTAVQAGQIAALASRALPADQEEEQIAARALHMLVLRANGIGGHLFVFQDGRLQLAASRHLGPPSMALQERIDSFLESWMEEGGGATRIDSTIVTASERSVSTVGPIAGEVRFRLELLTIPIGDRERAVAVAVIAMGEEPLTELPPAFLEAVANRLLVLEK
jgi:tRNA A-37 threonylcarbamoyl transferase component Bud32